MNMTFSKAIASFIGNAFVFVILAGFITKKVAGLQSFKDSFSYLGFRRDKNLKNNVLIGLGFAIIVPFIQLLAMALIGSLVSGIMGIEISEILRSYYSTIAESPIGKADLFGKLIIAFSMVFFVGIGEEVFFRGMIQKGSIAKFGKKIGLLITAVVFTLMHGFYMLELPVAIVSATALFVISIVFGILKEKTNSLIPSIIAHGVGNAIVYTITANLFYNLLK